MQKQRRSSYMSGVGLGSRGDRDNYRRTSTASQSTDAELDRTAYSSVAEYQVVFQQLKQEYPTSASGALHQMTMARIAEIKASHELEEQRERDKKEEEERPLNIFASKLVGMIMPGDTVGRRRLTVGSDSTSSLWNRRERDDFNSSSDSILGASGGGPRRGSTFGSRNNLGNDSMQSLWNRRERDDFNSSSDSILGASRPSILLRMSAPSDHQPPHSRRLLLFPRQDSNNPDFVNFARRTSNEPVPELDEPFTNSLEDKNMIGARSRRRSDISLLSDLSGLFDDENVDATTDHYDDEENIDLLRNDTDDNSKPTTSSSKHCRDINSDDQIIVTQLIGLDLSKNLPKTNEEKTTHRTTTMSVASDVTSSDCCSTASSNGMIVGFSDQRTNDDDNDLIVGFVNRRRCESPY
jgi:hypothetical protein